MGLRTRQVAGDRISETSSTSMPAAERAYALTMRVSSAMRCLRGRCSVSGVCVNVSERTLCRSIWTYAFRWLDILFYYTAHALKLRAHVGADANELDRVAQAHLAVWVHATFLDEALAQLGSRRSDLYRVRPVLAVPCLRGLHVRVASSSHPVRKASSWHRQ